MKRTVQKWPRAILFATFGVVLSSGGCGAEAEPTAITFANPQALVVGCANPPQDLEAEMWISGFQESCPLDVDVNAGTTTGDCVVTTGRSRTLTVDWFVTRGQTRVLLAQVQRTFDLTAVTEASLDSTISDADVEVLECRLMVNDQRDGEPTQSFNGVDAAVCDLDGDCGGVLDVGCANIGELCAGADPLLAN